MPGIDVNNTSPCESFANGIFRSADKKKFFASMPHKGSTKFLGQFDTEKDACTALQAYAASVGKGAPAKAYLTY